ncbi:MAG: c-type cytochrome [Xanthobacteraceae bacterium]|nr:c-type cytochrome [Xanthobacteraceae bacterium]
MPRHIVRLVLLMVAIGAVGYVAKIFFTADSFYEYGHYRGKSVAEIASDKPKYKGSEYCESCHAERFAEWSKGVHNKSDIGKVVKCEVCHGAAGERDVRGMFEHLATGVDHPNKLKLVVPTDARKLCTLCHEKMPGRPAQQPQIVVASHAGTQQCTVCHNPHSPKLNLVSTAPTPIRGDAARGKAKAAACVGCHGAEGVSVNLPGPSLAGQNAAYFIAALKAYGTGARDNPMMSAFAKGASDDDAQDLAAYFAALKCQSSLTAEKQAAAAGRATASKCIACHGADGVSSNRAWPNLVGHSKDYLVAALRAYKSGSRKGNMMAGIVKTLSDAETENVAAYYAGASCK